MTVSRCTVDRTVKLRLDPQSFRRNEGVALGNREVAGEIEVADLLLHEIRLTLMTSRRVRSGRNVAEADAIRWSPAGVHGSQEQAVLREQCSR